MLTSRNTTSHSVTIFCRKNALFNPDYSRYPITRFLNMDNWSRRSNSMPDLPFLCPTSPYYVKNLDDYPASAFGKPANRSRDKTLKEADVDNDPPKEKSIADGDGGANKNSNKEANADADPPKENPSVNNGDGGVNKKGTGGHGKEADVDADPPKENLSVNNGDGGVNKKGTGGYGKEADVDADPPKENPSVNNGDGGVKKKGTGGHGKEDDVDADPPKENPSIADGDGGANKKGADNTLDQYGDPIDFAIGSFSPLSDIELDIPRDKPQKRKPVQKEILDMDNLIKIYTKALSKPRKLRQLFLTEGKKLTLESAEAQYQKVSRSLEKSYGHYDDKRPAKVIETYGSAYKALVAMLEKEARNLNNTGRLTRSMIQRQGEKQSSVRPQEPKKKVKGKKTLNRKRTLPTQKTASKAKKTTPVTPMHKTPSLRIHIPTTSIKQAKENSKDASASLTGGQRAAAVIATPGTANGLDGLMQSPSVHVESKQLFPSTGKKKKKPRRSRRTRPQSVSAMKDHSSRAMFDLCITNMKKLQYNSTMENEKDRKRLPKLQHFMFTIDEMIEKPYRAINSNFYREHPLVSFLSPEGVNIKELGQTLMDVGKAMVRETDKGYKVSDHAEKYYRSVYGERETTGPRPPKKQKLDNL